MLKKWLLCFVLLLNCMTALPIRADGEVISQNVDLILSTVESQPIVGSVVEVKVNISRINNVQGIQFECYLDPTIFESIDLLGNEKLNFNNGYVTGNYYWNEAQNLADSVLTTFKAKLRIDAPLGFTTVRFTNRCEYVEVLSSSYSLFRTFNANFTIREVPITVPTVLRTDIVESIIYLKKNESKQLSSTVSVLNEAPTTLEWSVEPSNAGVTCVDGLVKVAHRAITGEYTIKATSAFDSTKSDTCALKVSENDVYRIELTSPQGFVRQGGTIDYYVNITAMEEIQGIEVRVDIDKSLENLVVDDITTSPFYIMAKEVDENAEITETLENHHLSYLVKFHKAVSFTSPYTLIHFNGKAKLYDEPHRLAMQLYGEYTYFRENIGFMFEQTVKQIDLVQSELYKPSVEKVTLDKTDISLIQGTSTDITATVLAYNSANTEVIYAVAPLNKGVTVNQNGHVIVGHNAPVGLYNVIVTSKFNPLRQAVANITVVEKEAPKLTLTFDKDTYNQGEEFTATVHVDSVVDYQGIQFAIDSSLFTDLVISTNGEYADNTITYVSYYDTSQTISDRTLLRVQGKIKNNALLNEQTVAIRNAAYTPYLGNIDRSFTTINSTITIKKRPPRFVAIDQSELIVMQDNSRKLTYNIVNIEGGVVWSIEPRDAGVTVVDGVVSASESAVVGHYIVKATSVSDSSIYDTKTITVKPYEKVANLLVVVKNSNKTTYVEGETFDKTGLVVKVIYSDKTEEIITNYEIINGSLSINKPLAIYYNGITKTLDDVKVYSCIDHIFVDVKNNTLKVYKPRGLFGNLKLLINNVESTQYEMNNLANGEYTITIKDAKTNQSATETIVINNAVALSRLRLARETITNLEDVYTLETPIAGVSISGNDLTIEYSVSVTSFNLVSSNNEICVVDVVDDAKESIKVSQNPSKLVYVSGQHFSRDQLKVVDNLENSVLSVSFYPSRPLISTDKSILLESDGYVTNVVVDVRKFGDVSGDGAVSVTDIVALAKHILLERELAPELIVVGDVDCKESIKVNDIVMLSNHILGTYELPNQE